MAYRSVRLSAYHPARTFSFSPRSSAACGGLLTIRFWAGEIVSCRPFRCDRGGSYADIADVQGCQFGAHKRTNDQEAFRSAVDQ